MNHSHSFSRRPSSVSWDTEREQTVVERDCTEQVTDGVGFQVPSGQPTRQHSACDAVKEERYKINSLVDVHDTHPGESSIVVQETAEPRDHNVHIDELDDDPDWLRDALEYVQGEVDARDAELFGRDVTGKEFSLLVATSETEYRAVFSRVAERVTD